MSVTFHIFPNRGLVFVQYAGEVALSDSFEAIAEYMRHPNYRPGQKQLVDLSRVTHFELDMVKLMSLQAQKADIFCGNEIETLVVYCAPTKIAQDVARMAMRSWEPFDQVIARVQETEADALALVGEPETSFEALMAQVDRA